MHVELKSDESRLQGCRQAADDVVCASTNNVRPATAEARLSHVNPIQIFCLKKLEIFFHT